MTGIRAQLRAKDLLPRPKSRACLRLVASPDGAQDSVLIHADAQLYSGLFDGAQTAELALDPARKAYVQVVRGQVEVNGTDSPRVMRRCWKAKAGCIWPRVKTPKYWCLTCQPEPGRFQIFNFSRFFHFTIFPKGASMFEKLQSPLGPRWPPLAGVVVCAAGFSKIAGFAGTVGYIGSVGLAHASSWAP